MGIIKDFVFLRSIIIPFNPTAYLARNPDVFAVYDNDLEAATRHYTSNMEIMYNV